MQRCSHGVIAVCDTSPRGVINASHRDVATTFSCRGSRVSCGTNDPMQAIRPFDYRSAQALPLQQKQKPSFSNYSGFNRLKLRAGTLCWPMTYAFLVEKAPGGELPAGFYYAHVPALSLTTHGHGIEQARAAAEDLIKLWLAEKKAAGEAIDLPSEFFFSTVDISESALQSA